MTARGTVAKGAQEATGPTAVCADAGTVRVMLGDQPAAGLFVLYRVAPPETSGDNKETDAKSKVPPAPAPPFTLCFVDGQGFLQKVTGDGNPWHDIAAQLAELEAGINPKKKDAKKKNAKKKVRARARTCESEKLHAEQDYELVFVAHPSLKVAKAAQTYLETGTASGPHELPKDRKTMILRGKLKLVTDKESQQLILPVDGLAPADDLAKLFWPKGSSRYGGFTLYRFMPHDHLQAVKDQVVTLINDLGGLRMPSSTSKKTPYPDEDESIFGINISALVCTLQNNIAEGEAFELETKLSAASSALDRRSAPEGWRVLRPHASWKWVCGKESHKLSKPYFFSRTQFHPGVVDRRVGDAIAGMVKDKLRHPGAVLIEIGGRMQGGDVFWGRPELVFSIEMLRVLLTRFGVPYGASLTHTFRPIQAKGGTGRAECSNHKLGLAVDFAICSAAGGEAKIEDHGHPPEYFPVRYEAVYGGGLPTLEKAQSQLDAATKARIQAAADLEKAKLDLAAATAGLAGLSGSSAAAQRKKIAEATAQQKAAAKKLAKAEKSEEEAASTLQQKHAVGETKADQKLSWVICAHSHWDVFAPGKKPAEIADELGKCLGKPANEEDEWDAVKEYRNLLLSGFDCEPTGQAAGLVNEFVGKMRALCERLTAMDPLDFRHQLFRQTVRQFIYNPFERDGGDEGPEITADSDDAWRSAMLDAKKRAHAFHAQEAHRGKVHCFVNFSRLANECDLWGISALPGNPTTKGSFRNPMTDPDIPDKPPARVSYVMNEQTFPPIAALLDNLRAAAEEAPDDKIDLAFPDGGKASLKVADLDVDFIIKWAEEMGTTQEDRIGKPEKGKKPPPQAISWDDNDAVILVLPSTKGEIDAFCNTFANKPIRVMVLGSQLKLEIAVGSSGSFSRLSKALLEYLGTLASADDKSQKQQPSTKKTNSDYSITVRPIFREKEGITLTSGTTITIPARGVPAPLEWWHYEQGLRARKSYGENSEQLGFALAVLGAGKAPPAADVSPETGGFGYPKKKLDNKRKLHKVTTGGPAADDSGDDDSDEGEADD
jgi:hypothetical protein